MNNLSSLNERLYTKVFTKENTSYNYQESRKYKEIIKLIDNQPKRILDIGCGDGVFTKILKDSFKSEVYGIDISKKALKKAQKRGIKIKNYDIDGKKLPFKNNYFDLVICGDVIEHIINTSKLIKEVKRILKKGGIVIASVPNFSAWYNRIITLFGYQPLWVDFSEEELIQNYITTGHVRLFNKKSLEALFKRNGLIINKIKGTYLRCPKNPHIKGKLRKIYNKTNSIIEKIESVMSKRDAWASVLIIKAQKIK